MKFSKLHVLVCILIMKSTFSQVVLDVNNPALDLNLYEDVLDPDLCNRQLEFIENDFNLRAAYLDAGARIPRGILTGNVADLGNYYQCLAINQNVDDMVIEGKYCMIKVPLAQDLHWPSLPSLPVIPWPPSNQTISEKTLKGMEEYTSRKSALLPLFGDDTSPRVSTDNPLASLTMRLAVCVPKPCTIQKAIDRLLTNLTSIGLQYEGNYCRLPNDKPWAPVDYTFIAVFGVILVLTTLSTGYDLYHTVFLEKDPKSANTIYRSFSVYTNTRRLVTYTANPGNLECVDGIRSFAMMWVILGHTFSTQMSFFMGNPIDAVEWMTSSGALWVTSSPITVDTFFMLSGLLVVYTTAGKFTGWKLLKSLHLFYMNRILRMFPILATGILFQASLANWVADGPYWLYVVGKVHKCRANWWATLLYVQNYAADFFCLGHSWYLAVDMQCYVICPIVLFWVLNGKKRQAWIALVAGLMIALVASTIYNFQKNFKSALLATTREDDDYFSNFYINTLTRCSPFFVGMIWGYVLHNCRGKHLKIGQLQNALLWCCATVVGILVIYCHYPVSRNDWDNQLVDNILNSYLRPVWAVVIGWMIFACVKGHGGILNWILSLRMWKLPSRMSYAMYILHYPLMFVVNSTALSPTYFTISFSIFTFIGHFFLTMFVSFLATVLIDAPFGILIKLAMSGGTKKNYPQKTDVNMNNAQRTNENVSHNDLPRYSLKTQM